MWLSQGTSSTPKGVAVVAEGGLVRAALEVEEGSGLEQERGMGGAGVGDGIALVGPDVGIGQGRRRPVGSRARQT